MDGQNNDRGEIDEKDLSAQRHVVGQGLHQRMDHAADNEQPGGGDVDRLHFSYRDQSTTSA